MLNKTLALVRTFHNLNKTQLADKVGISKSYVSEIESGDKKVTLEILEKYSSAFGIPVSSLMLFDETARNGSFTETIRVGMTGKIVQMLQWLATITDDTDAPDKEAQSKAHYASR